MRSILGDEVTGLHQIRGIWAHPVPRPETLPELEPTAFIATSKPSSVEEKIQYDKYGNKRRHKTNAH